MAMAKPWNPMADAYGNRDFNAYQQGPGANLDDSHQPAAIASSGNVKTQFRLCLKNVPKDMNTQGVRNLCSAYGKVVDVHTSARTPYVFVSFATLNDMERTLTGLKNNPHGIIADFAKDSKKASQSQVGSDSGKDENRNPANNIPSTSNQNQNQNQIDMNKRSIKGPFTNPPRPQPIRKQPLVTPNDYENSNLKIVDPQKHFLIQNDMHDSDRNKPKQENAMGGKHMHTGRPYYKEPKETTEQIRKLSESSKGNYNPQRNEYVNQSNVTLNGDLLGSCIRCSKTANKVCQRCEDFYCSIECQKRDWPKHRYICFQMPKLVPPNSRNIGVPLPENTPNLANATRNENQNVKRQLSDPRRQPKTQSDSNNQRNQQQPQQSTAKDQSHAAQNTTVKAPEPPKPKSKPSLKKVDLPASGSTVAMTAIQSSNVVYIRSLAAEDNIDYIRILNMINSEAKNCKLIEELPDRGDVCVTEFQNTGFYRVIVLHPINKDNIIVVYVDFGNVEQKKLSDLRELPEALNGSTRYSLPVTLKGIEKFEANEKILEYLNSFVDVTGKELKLVYEDENHIELIDLATNENINKKILDMLKVEVPTDADKPIMNSDIEMRLLPDGENIPVYVFDNSFLQTGCISCIHESDVLKLEGFNKKIQEYAEKTAETYTPREQEMCLVKYEEDGSWYRAECIEVVGDGHPSVLFIDYGNVTLAKIENIRKFPKEFCYPCFTSSCLIKDLPEELSTSAVKRLTELIPINEKLVLDKVTSVDDNEINEVHISKVLDTLKAEHLI